MSAMRNRRKELFETVRKVLGSETLVIPRTDLKSSLFEIRRGSTTILRPVTVDELDMYLKGVVDGRAAKLMPTAAKPMATKRSTSKG